jgi:hypothetical protein
LAPQLVDVQMTDSEKEQFMALARCWANGEPDNARPTLASMCRFVDTMLAARVSHVQDSSLDQGSSLKPNPKTGEPHGSSLVEKSGGSAQQPATATAANGAIPQSASGSARGADVLVQSDSPQPVGAELTTGQRAEPTEEEFAQWFDACRGTAGLHWKSLADDNKELWRARFRAARAGVRPKLRELTDEEIRNITPRISVCMNIDDGVVRGNVAGVVAFARAVLAAAQGDK